MVVCMLLLADGTTAALACTPMPETPWFTENLSVVSTDLPDSIILSIQNEQEGDEIKLENNADSSVWIEGNEGFVQLYDKNGIYFSAGHGGPNVLMVGDNYIRPLEARNVAADNRPESVALPAPQDVLVHLRATEQFHNLQLRVSYQLNPYYDPNSVYQHEHACIAYDFMLENFPFGFAPYLLIGIIIVCMIMIFISRRRERESSDQDPTRH